MDQQQDNEPKPLQRKMIYKIIGKDAIANRKVSKLFDEQALKRDVTRILEEDVNKEEQNGYNKIKFQNVTTQSQLNFEPGLFKEQKDQAAVNLTNRLEKLIVASHNLKNGLNQTNKQLEQNSKQVLENHDENQLKIMGKLSVSLSDKENVLKELQEKKVQLEQTQEHTVKKKQEMLSMKQFKEQLVKEMVTQNDGDLKKKNEIIKLVSDKVDAIKQLARQERDRRREIEEKIEVLEEQKMHLKQTLGDFDNSALEMSNLDHTQADFDKEKASSMRLKERLRELKLQLENSQNQQKNIQKNENDIQQEKSKQMNMSKISQSSGGQYNSEELRLRLEKLKNENKQYFDEYLSQMETLNGFTVHLQQLQSKKIELTEIANLLKDQNQFEKLSRRLQIRIETIEDQSRFQEDSYKELQAALKQIEQEIEVKNEPLEKELKSFQKYLDRCVSDKEELAESIRVVMSKVCNRAPQELKIDQIDMNMKSLLSYESKLEELESRSKELKISITRIMTMYFEYESSVRKDYYLRCETLIKSNDGLIQQVGSKLTKINEKIQYLEGKIKSKEATPDTDDQMIVTDQIRATIQSSRSQSKDISGIWEDEKTKLYEIQDQQKSNQSLLVVQTQEKTSLERIECQIGDFMGVFRDATEQNERLSKLVVKSLGEELEQKVKECEGQLEDFIKDRIDRKQDKCNRDVTEGQLLGKQVDDKIKQLEERLEMLNSNCEKADPEDQEEIQEKIEKVQRDLGKLKDQKKQLDKDLDNIMSSTHDDKALLDKKQKEIDNIINSLDAMLNSDLKDKEGSIDRIEEDLRDAIRKKRKQNREKCMKLYDQSAKGMKDLNAQMDKIKHSIEEVEDKIEQFQQMYNYPDLERTQEQNEELVKKIDEEKQKYQQMTQDKQQLQNKVNNLQKEVEQIQSLILGCPTLTNDINDNHKQGQPNKNEASNDEIVQKWEDCAQKTKEVLKQIQEGQRRASLIQDEVDTIHQVSDELMEKYKQKNKLYGECKLRRKELQDKAQVISNDLGELESGNLQQIELVLSKIVLPKNNKDFTNQYRTKLKDLENQKAKIQEQQDKIHDTLNTLKEIEQKLDKVGKQIVVTPELQDIKNHLDKLKLDYNYQKDQLAGLEQESHHLLQEVNQLQDKNKQILDQEADATHDNLSKELTDLEQLDKDTGDLLQQYNALINKGLQIDDSQVKDHCTDLKQQTNGIQKELDQIRKAKNTIAESEKQHRKLLKECENDMKNTSPSKLHDLNKQFEELVEQTNGVTMDFEKSKLDIEQRLKHLQDYLSKYNKLQNMFSNLIKELNKTKKNYSELNDLIANAELTSSLEKLVLSEMLKGKDNDYKNKEDFIQEKLKEIEAIDKNIKRLRDKRNDIDQMMEDIKFRESGMNDMSQEEVTELMEQCQVAQGRSEQLVTETQKSEQQLDRIKSDIGEADLQRLFKLRETGLEQFTQTLKQLEHEFQQVKRDINSGEALDNQEDLEDEMKDIDQKLQVHREERVQFKRDLAEDLHERIFIKRDKLKDLNQLSECVAKIVGMGITMDQSLNHLKKLQLLTEKLRKQVEGQDQMQRLQNLKQIESNERERIQVVHDRLQRINKGAQECDGYTSNSEESTFIETLLGELPEIEEKEQQALEECNKAFDQLDEIKRDVEGADGTDQIISKMNSVEGQLERNDKTIMFLEKLALKLETHFIEMDVKRKLEKRNMELSELQSICDDFNKQLQDMESHLVEDISKLEANKKVQGAVVMNMFVDEDGKPVNLLEEICGVQDDLKQVLEDVYGLQDESHIISQRREAVIKDFQEKILSRSPFKTGQHGKLNGVDNVFLLLRYNGVMKKRIIDLIKSLKAIRNRMKDQKQKYQSIRLKIEKQNKPRKFYKAIKGDLVDELFADYINKLNCPVPITRLGNNQYTFGTRKIFAKVINGKLVIRVGGGYMGIEEFMMYYGEQELTRLQKQEGWAIDDEVIGILDEHEAVSDHDEFSGGGGTGDNLGTSRSGRKSSMERACDIDMIKDKVRQQSARKQQRARSPYTEKSHHKKDHEEEKMHRDDGRTQIIGLGEVRKALKSNLVEIKTYQDNIQVGHNNFTPMGKDKSAKGLASSKAVTDSNALQIEKHLRNIERRVGDKLKTHSSKKDLQSPASARKLQKTTSTSVVQPQKTAFGFKNIQQNSSTASQKQYKQSNYQQQTDISRRSIQSEKVSAGGAASTFKAMKSKSPSNLHKKLRVSSPSKKELGLITPLKKEKEME